MSKVFRPWDVEEVWLFPASVQDYVPAGHIAHLVRDTVREEYPATSAASIAVRVRRRTAAIFSSDGRAANEVYSEIRSGPSG